MDAAAHLTTRRLLIAASALLAALWLTFVLSQGRFSVGRFSAAWFLAAAGVCTIARNRLAEPPRATAMYAGTLLWTIVWTVIAVVRLFVPS